MSEKTPVVSIVMSMDAAMLGALGAYLYASGAQSAVGTRYAYGTPIKLPNILGMLLMVVGIYLMGRQ